MDHTADLALEITAPDPTELLRRAAAGMMYLLLEELPTRTGERRELGVSSGDAPGLLREWLRELLFWHEAEGFATAEIEVRSLEPGTSGGARVEAVVKGGRTDRPPVREIKGVTLHGLRAEPRDGGWYGRVVFDV